VLKRIIKHNINNRECESETIISFLHILIYHFFILEFVVGQALFRKYLLFFDSFNTLLQFSQVHGYYQVIPIHLLLNHHFDACTHHLLLLRNIIEYFEHLGRPLGNITTFPWRLWAIFLGDEGRLGTRDRATTE